MYGGAAVDGAGGEQHSRSGGAEDNERKRDRSRSPIRDGEGEDGQLLG
jgi:hypothetical protein